MRTGQHECIIHAVAPGGGLGITHCRGLAAGCRAARAARHAGTAHALLTITEAGNFPARQCRPRTAVALRVIPPHAAHPAFIPLRFAACSRKGPIYLHIRVVRAGVGIPGFSR